MALNPYDPYKKFLPGGTTPQIDPASQAAGQAQASAEVVSQTNPAVMSSPTSSAAQLVPKPTTVKMATLVNPATQQRVAVKAGGPEAQNLFGQGFVLDQGEQKPSITGPDVNQPEAAGGDMTGDLTKDEVTDEKKQEDPVQGILERYGLKDRGAQSPFTTFAENYRQLYDSLGLTSVKGQIDEVNKEYLQLADEMAGKISDVNENPWLTEGQRRDKTQGVKDRYELRLSNLQNRITVLSNLHEAGRQEAQFIAGQAFSEMRQGQQFDQNLALAAIDRAEKQADAERKLLADKDKIETEVIDLDGKKVLINSKTGVPIREYSDVSGGDGGVGGYAGPDVAPAATQTFEQFLSEKENAAGMSFNPQKREQARKEFEAKSVPSGDKKEQWLSDPKVDARIKDVISGNSKFTDYTQTERKRLQAQYDQARNAGVIPKSTTAAQEAKFQKLTAKYDQNPIVRQADKAAGVNAIADLVIKNPKSSTNQLIALYSIVKQLDPESAVREGELSLAQSTLSRIDALGQEISRLDKGQVLPPKKAIEFAEAVKQLGTAWNSSLNRVNSRISSEAKVSGIEDMWSDYVGGFQETTGTGGFTSKSGKKYNLPN